MECLLLFTVNHHRRCSKHSSILTPAFLPPGEQQALPLGAAHLSFTQGLCDFGASEVTHTPTLLMPPEKSTLPWHTTT